MTNLSSHIPKLPKVKRRALQQQLDALRKYWQGGPPKKELKKRLSIKPVRETISFDPNKALDDSLMRKSKVACLVYAGGLGTRLGFSGPKGAYPISKFKKKTLFQILFEKVATIEKNIDAKLPISLLVSSYNHKMTLTYLKSHRYFGLDPKQITFLEQKNYPYFDLNRKIILNDNRLLDAPAGNGCFFEELIASSLLQRWQSMGIEYLHVIAIDNPLADPFDLTLLNEMQKTGAEIGVKAFIKTDPKENVGIIAEKKGTIVIADYVDTDPKLLEAKDKEGKLKYPLGNTGLYCFKLSFFKRLIKEGNELSLHWKKTNIEIDDAPQNVWKAEKFGLDLLAYSKKTVVVTYLKEWCFAPLKRLKGKEGVHYVQRYLQKRDRLQLERLTQKKQPHLAFELSADFLYPTKKLASQLKGKVLRQSGYITPSDILN